VIGQAPNPNFDKVKPKIDNHGQQRQQRHNRVKIYDDKSYMRKAKEAHRGHRTRRNEPDEEDIKPREGRRDRHKSRDERHRRKRRVGSERPTSLTHQKMQNDFE